MLAPYFLFFVLIIIIIAKSLGSNRVIPIHQSLQDDQVAAVPYIFKVDPDGFYLYARGDKNKVCVNVRTLCYKK